MDGSGKREAEDMAPDRPVFDHPAAAALRRVGVVDVGSNSVRLVIFDGAARSPHYFYNEKIMAALGAGTAETGRLNPEGRTRALSAIRRFQLLAKGFGIAQLTAVATAAVREAVDGPEFCADVLRDTGLKIQVIDGPEEARLSAQGVLLGWPDASGYVCDIGGSSMELAEVSQGAVGARETSSLGPLRLQAIRGRKRRRAHIRETVEAMVAKMGQQDRLYLVGGSWRAIARLDMERRGYPLHVMHEYRMTAKSIHQTLKWIDEHDHDALRMASGVSEARMSLVPLAGEVFKELIRAIKPKEIAISSYGIREGMLYQAMPEALRPRDPLIEACRFSEEKDARMPGFGAVLYRFLQPLFNQAPPNRQRLIQAACLLHDVNWRAHPDYRHEACFDSATRASLGGLTHTGRIFVGLALLHRYKSSREGTRLADLVGLLSEKDVHQAEVLGRAMRFASMLAASDATAMGALCWKPRKKELHLLLPRHAEGLFGEVAEARFNALATALASRPVVRRLARRSNS
ncbi:Exopolyphosphatase [Candidatus Rhodobacter oscarellae]|uniref:Exopolyphosphatase n=1 Tax=Candidatus Rhodobacter oscarellae TaxID=1675527 RepID=A0A0J9E4Z8_9RHOB|nr:Ppx/GppA family phosphatase [Candidatus Rhodobacter lobularis]KMW57812.1 Exopolyphosphatase [Candidatus Rhodobacter lobularis]